MSQRRKRARIHSQRNASQASSQDSSDDRHQDNQLDATLVSQSGITSIPKNILDKLTSDCVYYLLIANQKKLPIKKPDIVKHVMKNHSKGFSYVIDHAKEILKTIYGINLAILPEGKGFILINNQILYGVKDVPIWPPLDAAKQGMLTIILSIIFMNGGSVPEKILWHCLSKFGISQTNTHDFFGNCKHLMDEFVRQLHLECIQTDTMEEKSYNFRWGIRANLEVKKRTILNFFCKVYSNGMKPQNWQAQWAEVQKEGENDVEENTLENAIDNSEEMTSEEEDSN